MKLQNIKMHLFLICAFAFLTSCQKGADEAEALITEPKMTTEDAAVPTRTEESKLSITADVVALDFAKRELTLMVENGNSMTFIVGDDVKRLDELSVGDRVYIDYLVTVTMELREPTTEEMKIPLTAIKQGIRATSNQPAGVKGHSIKAVSIIVGIDLPTETATLQGPMGQLMTVKAKNPENLAQVKIGDTVIVTYTETLAVAVAKLDHDMRVK